MFELVLAVTIATGDIDASERAYREFLDYEVVSRQEITWEQANVWDANNTLGRKSIVMQPSSGKTVYLRFVEAPEAETYEPLTTHGWNATEFLVQDVEKMRRRLDDSPFDIIGEPAYLTDRKLIKAMQAIGPSKEVIYLTQFESEPLFERYGRPTSLVDRPFILVIGGPDHDTLVQFYGPFLGHEVQPFGEFPVTVLSRSMGLPKETTYPLSTTQLGGRFRFELDGYPEAAKARARGDGELPTAMAMVTVTTKDMDSPTLLWRSPPRTLPQAPYNGRRVGVTVGPAGEWIEVVEAKD